MTLEKADLEEARRVMGDAGFPVDDWDDDELIRGTTVAVSTVMQVSKVLAAQFGDQVGSASEMFDKLAKLARHMEEADEKAEGAS